PGMARPAPRLPGDLPRLPAGLDRRTGPDGPPPARAQGPHPLRAVSRRWVGHRRPVRVVLPRLVLAGLGVRGGVVPISARLNPFVLLSRDQSRSLVLLVLLKVDNVASVATVNGQRRPLGEFLCRPLIDC